MKVQLNLTLQDRTFAEIENAFAEALAQLKKDHTGTKAISSPEPTFHRNIGFDANGYACGTVRITP